MAPTSRARAASPSSVACHREHQVETLGGVEAAIPTPDTQCLTDTDDTRRRTLPLGKWRGAIWISPRRFRLPGIRVPGGLPRRSREDRLPRLVLIVARGASAPLAAALVSRVGTPTSGSVEAGIPTPDLQRLAVPRSPIATRRTTFMLYRVTSDDEGDWHPSPRRSTGASRSTKPAGS